MDNIVFVATIAGVALGAVFILAFFLNSQNNNAALPQMSYKYDEQNRLQSVQPVQNVQLTPIGDEQF